MNQVLLGMAAPYCIGLIWYILRRFRASIPMLITVPVTMALGALWAVAPDIPRVLRMDSLYDRLYRDPRCNIFLWHYDIDKVESYSPIYLAVFIVITLTILIAAWRELRARETQ